MLRVCLGFVLAIMPVTLMADPQGRIGVVDADTWDVGGVRVRIYGIDALEIDQTCLAADGTPWACGRWATEQARMAYAG